MRIETLISTMNKNTIEEIKQLIDSMQIETDAIVVNQNSKKDNIEEWIYKNNKIKIINKKEKGLSKSRNQLLCNSNADIGIIADDDMQYLKDYSKEIDNAFNKNEEADIICFKVYKGNKAFKNYKNKREKIGYLKILKKSSVEIAFKIKPLQENNIKFDEDFGSGAKMYTSGEENIFLRDCLKKGLKIIYEPLFIARLDDKNDSTWFKGFNEQYFKTKGAVFERLTHTFSVIYIWMFAIKKYSIYKGRMKFLDALKCMRTGKKEYKKVRNQSK